MFKMIADMVGFNHSVFSGAMDVIAIKDKNGEIRSTSFHVRFGSFKVLKSKSELIEISTNNIKTNVTMKLSSSGDAYFTLDEKTETQNTFEDIIAENFPNLGTEPLTQFQDTQRVPPKTKPRRNTLRHI